MPVSSQSLHAVLAGPEVLLTKMGLSLTEEIKKLHPRASFEFHAVTDESALEEVARGEAHLAIVTVGLAYYLYGYGLRTLDVSAAVTLTLAEPLTAVLLGVSVLDERLRPFGWAGAALVVTGLVLAGGAVDRQAS